MTPCSQSRCANRTALHPDSSSVSGGRPGTSCAKIAAFFRSGKLFAGKAFWQTIPGVRVDAGMPFVALCESAFSIPSDTVGRVCGTCSPEPFALLLRDQACPPPMSLVGRGETRSPVPLAPFPWNQASPRCYWLGEARPAVRYLLPFSRGIKPASISLVGRAVTRSLTLFPTPCRSYARPTLSSRWPKSSPGAGL